MKRSAQKCTGIKLWESSTFMNICAVQDLYRDQILHILRGKQIAEIDAIFCSAI